MAAALAAASLINPSRLPGKRGTAADSGLAAIFKVLENFSGCQASPPLSRQHSRPLEPSLFQNLPSGGFGKRQRPERIRNGIPVRRSQELMEFEDSGASSALPLSLEGRNSTEVPEPSWPFPGRRRGSSSPSFPFPVWHWGMLLAGEIWDQCWVRIRATLGIRARAHPVLERGSQGDPRFWGEPDVSSSLTKIPGFPAPHPTFC